MGPSLLAHAWPRVIRAAVATVIAGAFTPTVPREGAAQQPADTFPHRITNWWVPGVVGGFSMGAALGYTGTMISRWNIFSKHVETGDALPRYQDNSWSLAIAGALVGGTIGAMVDSRVRHGRPVSTFKNKAVRFATVVAGAGIGTAVSYRVLTDYHEKFYWNPVRVVWVVTLGPALGSVGGYVVQHLSPYPPRPAERSSR